MTPRAHNLCSSPTIAPKTKGHLIIWESYDGAGFRPETWNWEINLRQSHVSVVCDKTRKTYESITTHAQKWADKLNIDLIVPKETARGT